MGKLERRMEKERLHLVMNKGLEYEEALLDRIKELEARNLRLAEALNSDVRIIAQAGEVIQTLGEKIAKYEKILKARGLMTLDGNLTVLQ